MYVVYKCLYTTPASKVYQSKFGACHFITVHYISMAESKLDFLGSIMVLYGGTLIRFK